jgi:hypothetical protein
MNKNQKQIRAFARRNDGQCRNVARNYSAGLDQLLKPTDRCFSARFIPQTEQKRKSNKAKVGQP